MDYRDILKRYMDGVLDQEGCDFLWCMRWDFSEEEFAELERIREEIERDRRHRG